MANRAWFVYTGALNDDFLNSDNYLAAPSIPGCSTTGREICSIYGIVDRSSYGDHPSPINADPKLKSYIISAFTFSSAQPIGLGVKRYVYVRDCC